ncbi:MAG: 1-deoxy-D-xylulose-5-phosphate synthase, partial [Betaproteobacteria bacterium]|nr:1-deoxy-D-xylulose-5-phosphate synthase [Betaproteobacteria bacterium]
PLDEALVIKMALTHDLVVSVEENTILGGAGSAVGEVLSRENIATPLLQLGLPDRFIDQGDPAQLLADCGLDAAGIAAAVESRRQGAASLRTGAANG